MLTTKHAIFSIIGNEFNFFNSQGLNISRGSAYNAVSKVIEACVTPDLSKNGISFVKRHIRLPDEESARESGVAFLSRARFPATFPPVLIGGILDYHVAILEEDMGFQRIILLYKP